MERFYVSTPIYYVNAEPHIGHAYTTIVADVMNRFHKLLGYKTFFLTGTDEHGDKIAQAAQDSGTDPKSYADRISQLFRETWPKLNISNDHFIRTTDPEHIQVVQNILQKVYDSGDIYFSTYKGLYCVGCERFYTEKELVDGKCPDHDKEPIEREEANYFFRMSKYQDWLIQHIESHPDFIRPERYRNEVLAFLREPLEDLCISRPKERLSWGIPLPFDDRYVTYVWFDALINYVSALNYPDGPLFHEFWPVVQHTIAKDILKPHGIYWPTMIKAAGFAPYQHLNVHGYWKTSEGKMSKSRGTVVRPLDLVPIYGLDAFRYFLMREMVFGLDSNFSEEALVQRLNADLANDLGNLYSRTLAMTAKYFEGKIPPFGAEPDDMDRALMAQVENATKQFVEEIPKLGYHKALMAIWECISAANKYIDHVGPWNLAKDPQQHSHLQTVIRILLELNKTVAVLISPFMPETSEKMLERLGIPKKALDLRLKDDAAWGTLQEGNPVQKGESLFPRVELKEHKGEKPAGEQPKQPSKKQPPVKESREKEEEKPENISFDAFKQVDLRVGLVKEAERIPKSKKLLRLIVDIGEERQVVAGIAETHAPEDLVGKQVVIVANLQPAKLMGVESHGMVLAVRDGESLHLLTPEKPVTPGRRIS
ncbi:methionine--tRNA ligase [Desulforhabdus amnigena]|uniref:Methionine--tRNA ligase n=1 Tax=Desulforhabdus amnigena TaxID=40218 RepID=A0A9W6D5E9_9BACT|nr:methionine--tRNA ligase [Desulforhabdus amnigena]NLJ27099.1 methionine--tRNA ligase [Deltaproteobacteria bacterium]GLI34542.1 methionine--tRNA ligase [Desulforhabdus amnigena]